MVEQAAAPKRFLRSITVLLTNLLSMGDGPTNPGGRILRVVDRRSGADLFRHIETIGEDHPDMLQALERDLATMSADEFAKVWG